MFDIGMSELMLIGIVALIVIGPKDLPALFHTLGRFTAKMRSLGREFTNAMNAAARESGMDDVAKGLKGVANPKKFGLDKLGEAADRFDKWEPGKPAAPKAPVDPERAADIEKIRAASEKAGQARLDREAAARAGSTADPAAGGTTGEGSGPKAAGAGAAKTPAAAARKPAKPAAIEKPAAKAKPAKPAAAAKPAKPAAAAKPAKPAARAKPAKPAAPAKPAKARPAPAAAPKADET